MIRKGMKRAFRRGVQHYVQQSLPAIACRLMIKQFIDSELCGIEKIEDRPCNRGIFKTPLQGLSSYLSRKRHKKIFPLSSLKNGLSLQFLLKRQGQTLSNGLFIAPCQTLSSYLLYELLQIFLVESSQRKFEYTRFALFGRIIEYDRIAVDMRLKHIQAVGRIRVRYDIEKSHCRDFGCGSINKDMPANPRPRL